MIVSHKHSVIAVTVEELNNLGRLATHYLSLTNEGKAEKDLTDLAWQLQRVSVEGMKVLAPKSAPGPERAAPEDLL